MDPTKKPNLKLVETPSELTPLTDCNGISLSVGDKIVFMFGTQQMEGIIVEYKAGGLLVAEGDGRRPVGQTPSRVRVIVDVTITLNPGQTAIGSCYRTPNPKEGEEIIKRKPLVTN